MSINENADLDPSQVEDLRGGRAGGGRPPSGGIQFPGLVTGGGGGGAGGGRGGLGGAGAGCLTALTPMLKKNPKVGWLLLIVVAVCVGGLLCYGGGNMSQLGDLGGLGGIGGGTGVQQADNSTLEQVCSTANPDRFQRADCRNLLYINSVQAYWQSALPQYFGQQYQKAPTRLFSGQVSTACGSASSGVGPFYCPGDQRIYIDLSFYDELSRRFGASGQFAQAYVLAHEYGHHVQTLLGTEAQVRRAQQRDPGNANLYSVAMELQADCYAGAWASAASRTTSATGQPLFTRVTQQDINEALEAAAAVGDDNIQRQSGLTVDESGFTHGSSQQRQQWFNQGFSTGDPRQCNTFGS